MNRDEFEKFEALLPEYVNGSLGDTDIERLETALRQSGDLKEALERERQLHARFKRGVATMLDDAEKNTEKRLDALKKEAGKQQTAESGEKSQLASALAFLNPRRWHPAIALSLAVAIPAQAAVISTQAVAIASLQDENFRLASGPCAEDTGKSGIILEFAENAGWQEVAELLDGEELTIFERGGFGTLTVRSKKTGAALQAQIDKLDALPIVVSADRAG